MSDCRFDGISPCDEITVDGMCKKHRATFTSPSWMFVDHLRDIIDRLTKLEAEYQKKIDRLREANAGLMARMEELEKERDWWASVARDYKADYNEVIRTGKCADGHHITDEQISAAWVYAHSLQPGSEVRISILYALRLLGFERCEKCGGECHVFLPGDERVAFYTKPCPDCDGHGWVNGGWTHEQA